MAAKRISQDADTIARLDPDQRIWMTLRCRTDEDFVCIRRRWRAIGGSSKELAVPRVG
jgi:hypothetical protein